MKNIWGKRKTITRLEIMVVTRVYCEKLLKLFDFSGRVV